MKMRGTMMCDMCAMRDSAFKFHTFGLWRM
jgi:hypothetical protein